MIKALLILAIFVLLSYVITGYQYDIFIRTFNYEFSCSIFILLAILIFLAYLIKVITKPFRWIFGHHRKKQIAHLSDQQEFLQLILTTELDKNSENKLYILKKTKSDSLTSQLALALFNPSITVYRNLLKEQSTELAGLRGLYFIAKGNGDWLECARLLDTAQSLYKNVEWIFEELYDLKINQKEWQEALSILENLKKRFGLSETLYRERKGILLMHLGDFKKSFSLAPENTQIALAYALKEPAKAKEILKKAFEINPSWDLYLAYKKTISLDLPQKQMKMIKDFVSKTPDEKLALLAQADSAMQAGLWGIAKDFLQSYLEAYPVTQQVALMMADIEREGWNNSEEAQEWEQKAL